MNSYKDGDNIRSNIDDKSEQRNSEELSLADRHSKKVNENEIEKLFFIAGLIVVLVAIVLSYFFGDINSDPKKISKGNVLNVGGILLGVGFSVFNMRAWKLFAGMLLRNAAVDRSGLARLSLFMIGKLAVIVLLVSTLSRYRADLIPSFLTGIAGYLLLGSVLISILFRPR